MENDLITTSYINSQIRLLEFIFEILETEYSYKCFPNVDKKQLENYAKSQLVLGYSVKCNFIGYTKQDLVSSMKQDADLFIKGYYNMKDILPLLNNYGIDYIQDKVLPGYFSLSLHPTKEKIRQIVIDQFLIDNK